MIAIENKWEDGNVIYRCEDITTRRIFVTRTELMIKIVNKYGCKFMCKCEEKCAFFEEV